MFDPWLHDPGTRLDIEQDLPGVTENIV